MTGEPRRSPASPAAVKSPHFRRTHGLDPLKSRSSVPSRSNASNLFFYAKTLPLVRSLFSPAFKECEVPAELSHDAFFSIVMGSAGTSPSLKEIYDTMSRADDRLSASNADRRAISVMITAVGGRSGNAPRRTFDKPRPTGCLAIVNIDVNRSGLPSTPPLRPDHPSASRAQGPMASLP